MVKESEEKAEKERLEREERAKVEKERAAAEEKRRVRRGVIYGDDYQRYSVEEIRSIKDYDFLNSMFMNRFGPAQPPTDEEYDDMLFILNTIRHRMDELLEIGEIELLLEEMD